jgi:hypothetical protein
MGVLSQMETAPEGHGMMCPVAADLAVRRTHVCSHRFSSHPNVTVRACHE